MEEITISHWPGEQQQLLPTRLEPQPQEGEVDLELSPVREEGSPRRSSEDK